MAASYPAALKSYTTKTNKVDLVDAAHMNSVQEEIIAIQTELGIDPAGSCVDLKTRLAVSIHDDGAIKKGTSFPGSPIEGQLFYRSDEDILYVRGDASWLGQGSSLSNVVFCFGLGGGSHVANVNGIILNDSIVAAYTEIACGYWAAKYAGSFPTVYRTIILTKFKKIAGISTVTVHCSIWQASSYPASCKVIIGSVSGSVDGTDEQTTPEWKNFAIDVSGLTNGTTYDVTIQLGIADGVETDIAYLDSIIGIAS